MKFSIPFKLPERKPKEKPPAGVIPEWLVWQAKALAWLAMLSLIYFMWLFSLDAARDTAQALHLTKAGTWEGEVFFWFPTIIGFVLIAIGVPWLGKIVIPAFVSLKWSEHEQGWPKFWLLVLTLAGSAVIIAGSITVQTETRFERNRELVVKEESAEQGRAALEAQKAQAEKELQTMMDNRNAYLAQAASVGAAEWQKSYIDQAKAKGDPQLDRIERALGAARAADTKRAEISRLTTEIATAKPAAASAARVVRDGSADAWMGNFIDWLASIRAILLAVLMDIVCLLMPWIALRLEQARSRQLAALNHEPFVTPSGEVDESHMISDMRSQPKIVPEEMERPREEVFDAETGERLVEVRMKKDRYFRKVKPKKGEPTPLEPDVADEQQAAIVGNDAELRASYTPASAIDAPAEAEDAARVMNAILAAVEEEPKPQAPPAAAPPTDIEDLWADAQETEIEIEEEPQPEEVVLANGEGVMVTEEKAEEERV